MTSVKTDQELQIEDILHTAGKISNPRKKDGASDDVGTAKLRIDQKTNSISSPLTTFLCGKVVEVVRTGTFAKGTNLLPVKKSKNTHSLETPSV